MFPVGNSKALLPTFANGPSMKESFEAPVTVAVEVRVNNLSTVVVRLPAVRVRVILMERASCNSTPFILLIVKLEGPLVLGKSKSVVSCSADPAYSKTEAAPMKLGAVPTRAAVPCIDKVPSKVVPVVKVLSPEPDSVML